MGIIEATDKVVELSEIVEKLKLLSNEMLNDFFSNNLAVIEDAGYVKYSFAANAVKFDIINDYIRFAQDVVKELDVITQSIHNDEQRENKER